MRAHSQTYHTSRVTRHARVCTHFAAFYLTGGAGNHRPECHGDTHVPVGCVARDIREQVERQRVRSRVGPPYYVSDDPRKDEGHEAPVTGEPVRVQYIFRLYVYKGQRERGARFVTCVSNVGVSIKFRTRVW